MQSTDPHEEIRRRLAEIPDPLALLEGIFAYSPVAFQIFAPDGHCVLVNQTFRELFGSEPPPEYNILTDEIAVQRGFIDLIHRAFAGETVRVPPVWYDPRDLAQVAVDEGNRVAIASTIFPLRDRHGDIAYIALVFQDLTEEIGARERAEADRAHAEQAAREKEQARALLDTLMATAPVGLGFVGTDLRYLRINQELADINGRAAEDLVGCTLAEVNPSLAAELEPLYRHVLATGAPSVDHEVAGETGAAPGQMRHWLVSHYPVKAPTGEITGVGVVVHEITERKRFENAQRFLADAGAVLMESLDRESALQAASRFAVSAALADWCSVYLLEEGAPRRIGVAHRDPAKVELLEDVGRRYPVDMEPPHPVVEVLETGASRLVPEIAGAVVQQAAVDDEHLELLRELGAKSAMVVPIRGRSGVIGAIEFVIAESDRRYEATDLVMAEGLAARAGLALDNARLYEEVQQALRVRQDLLAIVSHDLKNPLGSISMNAAMLAKTSSARDLGRVKKQAMVVQRAAERMERLLQDLLDASRIEAGHFTVEQQPYPAEEIVDEVVSALGPEADERGIRLDVEPSSDAGYALCDRDRVLQVLANLVGNSLKFTEAAGRVVVGVRRAESAVQFSVRDTGRGIDQTSQDHIFDRYWQERGDRGTGLGLFICRGIVEAHGGRIWVESSPGAGSMFAFTTPAAPPPAEKPAARGDESQ